ncbi:hypothetical protein QSV08_07725 [Maribacter sp. BPC-D8]|uniref:hypothetical protein n=1 Tax=Maribacter sp. BPC-D8 TaxID=3053613 RepID=UPI002B4917C9|nr:hypothetical protein [Maribacter sp. BPC-D8]WRI31133.1 hypothetical protein QSV08_07725 [Maribacter sp. BPC-D8]
MNGELKEEKLRSTNIDDIINDSTEDNDFDVLEVKLDSTNIDDIISEKTENNDFDLLKVKLGETNIDDIINEKTDDNDFVLDGDKFRSSESKKILSINNVALQNQTRESSYSNYVSFEYDEKNIITAYTLAYFTLKENPKIVYNQLTEKLGTPSFKHFNSSYKENKNLDAVIWEDKENNKFYRLEYYLLEDEGLRESTLTVLINSESDIEDPTYSGQPFYYWRDYIKARNEFGKDNFTYQEFIKRRGSYSLYTE